MRLFPWAAVLASSCSSATRDAVPPTRDLVVHGGGPARPSAAYDYVARRQFAAVGLAEARGIEPALAHAAVEQLAERLEACAVARHDGGALPTGAARVVAHLAPNGTVAATNVRVDPGADVAETALLCLVAPTRRLTFPPSNASTRGFAIEALWGALPPPTRER